MGLFRKAEVVVIKESSDSQKYLKQLESLVARAEGAVKEKIEKEIKITKAGIIGEEAILFELRNSGMDMYILHDIYIESGTLAAQIDFYVITPKVDFIIECKNLFGDIEINNRGEFVRTFDINGKKVKEGIYSPITQNERHLLVVKNKKMESVGGLRQIMINRYFDDFHKSLIVLANPKTVLNSKYAKKEVKEKVIRLDQLIETIKTVCRESKEVSSSKKEMQERAERILSWNVEERKEYIQKYQDLLCELESMKREENTAPLEQKMKTLCPLCGKELVERKGKFGDFWGCSGYPKCRFTKKSIS